MDPPFGKAGSSLVVAGQSSPKFTQRIAGWSSAFLTHDCRHHSPLRNLVQYKLMYMREPSHPVMHTACTWESPVCTVMYMREPSHCTLHVRGERAPIFSPKITFLVGQPSPNFTEGTVRWLSAFSNQRLPPHQSPLRNLAHYKRMYVREPSLHSHVHERAQSNNKPKITLIVGQSPPNFTQRIAGWSSAFLTHDCLHTI